MYIKVRVNAGVKKESFLKKTDDHFDITVKEPASRNLANRRVQEIIANHYKLPTGKVRLISGHQSPSKIFNIDLDN